MLRMEDGDRICQDQLKLMQQTSQVGRRSSGEQVVYSQARKPTPAEVNG